MPFESHRELRFPVSVKGVLLEADRVVLLLNDRDEWELPGGRLEHGEDPVAWLASTLVVEFSGDLPPEKWTPGYADFASAAEAAHTRANPGFLHPRERRTRRWREMDSNFQFRAR